MMFNCIVAMLHNTATDRYHPVFFYESPLPGPPSDGKSVRHKSKMHHTGGFDSREEAIASFDEQRFKDEFGNFARCLDEDIEWDGEGTPAMVKFFSEDGTKILL